MALRETTFGRITTSAYEPPPGRCQRLTPGGPSPIDRYAYNMHTASMGIEYDPAKAAANLKKHGVSFAHAEQALRDPLALTIEDPDAQGEIRYVTLGMDALGRLLSLLIPRAQGGRALFPLARQV